MKIIVVSNLPPHPPPSVGIFFGIRAGQQIVLACHGSSLADAETAAGMVDHRIGHYELWESWQQRGATALARSGLPAAIAKTEYDAWPRGRIVHDLTSRRFILYADRRLHAPAIIQNLLSAFGLSSDRTTVRTDPHYRT